MITDNNKKLAQWAMDFALKNGCQAAKVVLYANSNTSFELREAKMDRLQQASESGMGINVYVDGRYGNYSTNRLDRKNLKHLSRMVLSLPVIWLRMNSVYWQILPAIIQVGNPICRCSMIRSLASIRMIK